jgi:hypothetical protein
MTPNRLGKIFLLNMLPRPGKGTVLVVGKTVRNFRDKIWTQNHPITKLKGCSVYQFNTRNIAQPMSMQTWYTSQARCGHYLLCVPCNQRKSCSTHLHIRTSPINSMWNWFLGAKFVCIRRHGDHVVIIKTYQSREWITYIHTSLV